VPNFTCDHTLHQDVLGGFDLLHADFAPRCLVLQTMSVPPLR
jgi:hypothetical protein